MTYHSEHIFIAKGKKVYKVTLQEPFTWTDLVLSPNLEDDNNGKIFSNQLTMFYFTQHYDYIFDGIWRYAIVYTQKHFQYDQYCFTPIHCLL